MTLRVVTYCAKFHLCTFINYQVLVADARTDEAVLHTPTRLKSHRNLWYRYISKIKHSKTILVLENLYLVGNQNWSPAQWHSG